MQHQQVSAPGWPIAGTTVCATTGPAHTDLARPTRRTVFPVHLCFVCVFSVRVLSVFSVNFIVLTPRPPHHQTQHGEGKHCRQSGQVQLYCKPPQPTRVTIVMFGGGKTFTESVLSARNTTPHVSLLASGKISPTCRRRAWVFFCVESIYFILETKDQTIRVCRCHRFASDLSGPDNSGWEYFTNCVCCQKQLPGSIERLRLSRL